MEKLPMTAAGYAVLEAELKHCQQVERPRIIQQITEARRMATCRRTPNITPPRSSSRSTRGASWSSRTSSRAPT